MTPIEKLLMAASIVSGVVVIAGTLIGICCALDMREKEKMEVQQHAEG